MPIQTLQPITVKDLPSILQYTHETVIELVRLIVSTPQKKQDSYLARWRFTRISLLLLVNTCYNIGSNKRKEAKEYAKEADEFILSAQLFYEDYLLLEVVSRQFDTYQKDIKEQENLRTPAFVIAPKTHKTNDMTEIQEWLDKGLIQSVEEVYREPTPEQLEHLAKLKAEIAEMKKRPKRTPAVFMVDKMMRERREKQKSELHNHE